MNALDNLKFDVWKHITIDKDPEDGAQIITYRKKGYGVQTTKRPLGAVRLELALDEIDMSQSELARKIGSKQPAISRIIRGQTKNSHLINPIAKLLGKSPEWLAGNDTADKSIALIQENLIVIDNEPFAIVKHHMVDIDENAPDSKSIVIVGTEQLLEGQDKESLRFIIEPDRAMSPDIKQGASVTFDKSDKAISNGDMFVIKVGESICTRCLFTQPDGSILIRAKESDFPDYTIKKDDTSFKVLGRVLFVTNKI